MATVKLKDVLKSLPQDTSLTGSEMVVINDNGENKYIPYSTIRNGLVNASERKTLANTAEWLIAHDNVTTIDALNKELDAFGAETAQGLHRMKCFGIPLFVTFANLNVGDSVLMQTIQGSITFNSSKTSIASINTTGNLAIAVRYHQGGKWGSWNTPMTPIEPPTVQTSVNGTTKNYIYSNGTDADKNCVASCNWWIYSENGRIYVRWKRWGADNNTHYDHDNEEHQTSQYMIPYMGSDGGACYQDGLLPWQWGQRMKDCGVNFRFIREELSTAECVNLRYLNFANGGAYDTPISKATSAKAGVMTAADKTKLDNLTAYARDLGNFESEEAALDALKAIEISSNSNIVHVHCTYANGAMSITMMQSIENDYTRQIIFNKSKVFQRAIYFTNGTRQEISHVEDWSCLFGDRLHWDSGENKYVLSQFGLPFNEEHTDPIPTATTTNDGLMSATDKQLLEQIKTKLGL